MPAHLDGLVLGEKEAWRMLEPKLTGGELGEVFTATFVALDSMDAERIDLVIKTFGQADGDIFEGIRHALRHSSYPEIERIVRPCLTAEKKMVQSAAVDVLSFRRLPVEIGQLQDLLNDPDPQLVAAAINAVGRLRVAQLKEYTEQSMSSDVPDIRREARRTGLLLGSRQALSHCRKAIRDRPEEAKDALILLGLAGEAISRITGVNIVGEKLVAEKPVKAETGAKEEIKEEDDDDEEEFIEDHDEDLSFVGRQRKEIATIILLHAASSGTNA